MTSGLALSELSTGTSNEKQARRSGRTRNTRRRSRPSTRARRPPSTCAMTPSWEIWVPRLPPGRRPEDRARAQPARRAAVRAFSLSWARALSWVREAKAIKLTATARRPPRWKTRALARRKLPRAAASTSSAHRAASSLTVCDRGLPRPQAAARGDRGLASPPGMRPQTGGFQRIPEELIERLDNRAHKYFLRIAAWFSLPPWRWLLWAKAPTLRQSVQERARGLLCRCRNCAIPRWRICAGIGSARRARSGSTCGATGPKATPGRALIARDLWRAQGGARAAARRAGRLRARGYQDPRRRGASRARQFCRKYLGEGQGHELRKRAWRQVVRKHGLEKTCKLLHQYPRHRVEALRGHRGSQHRGALP